MQTRTSLFPVRNNCKIPFSILALTRDSIIEQPCLFHLTLSPSLETFLNIEQEIWVTWSYCDWLTSVVNSNTHYNGGGDSLTKSVLKVLMRVATAWQTKVINWSHSLAAGCLHKNVTHGVWTQDHQILKTAIWPLGYRSWWKLDAVITKIKRIITNIECQHLGEEFSSC